MKAVILCAGEGKRLHPISYSLPKQLIPIANKPLLVYTIELLFKLGIKEIGIVVNKKNETIFKNVLSKYITQDIKYIVQEKPKGVADSLLKAEDYVEEEKFIMLLGDNVFHFNIKGFIKNFFDNKNNCRILLKKVENPESFGVAYIGNNRIINLEEKPKIAFSDLAITGLYAFDNSIFKACKKIKLSPRNEYEITEAIRWLLKKGFNVGYDICNERWRDIGRINDVLEENISRLSSIEEDIKGEIINSNISSKVVLKEGGVIFNSIVRGPVIIGENTVIKHSYIGPYTSIGNNVKINKSSIEGSILLDGCLINEIKTIIDDSIIGRNSIITNKKTQKKANSFILGEKSKIYL